MKDLKSYVISLFESVRHAKLVMQIGKEAKQRPIGLVYFDIREFGLLEERFGRAVSGRVLKTLRVIASDANLAARHNVLMHKCVGDDLFLFIELPQDQDEVSQTRYVHREAELLHAHFEHELNLNIHLGLTRISLHMGTAILSLSGNVSIERVLYSGLKEAVNQAKNSLSLEAKVQQAEFQAFVEDKRITTHFQPIVDLTTGNVHACEALSRGPAGTSLESPMTLFDYAEQIGSLVTLEKIALENAIVRFREFEVNHKLFINVDARVIQDAENALYQTLRVAEDCGISPQRIVLEITERNAVDDYKQFNRLLSTYRTMGYGIAVDDAGMGYSSLQAIAELKPDYIKIDKSLVRDVDNETVKMMMVETLVDLARKLNCSVIAEGIERVGELKKIIHLGVDLGQGYYFSKPKPTIPRVDDEALQVIQDETKRRVEFLGETVNVGAIARQAQTFDENALIGDVVAYFNANEHAQGVVITRNHTPIGLVMKEKLFRNLATQYGVSLYLGRTIDQLMDGNPLTVDVSMSVESLSRITMTRDPERLYDFVIVTKGDELFGVATVQGILDTITTTQIEFARDANPLTGLPGNRRIERDLARRISGRQPFSIIYADLDHFKWYNDTRGFQHGDMVIGFVADVLMDTLELVGQPGDFVGHVGGDDFVLVTSHEIPHRLCEEIIRRFDSQIDGFYDAKTAQAIHEHGWIDVLDRSLKPVKTKGLTISLSLLDCVGSHQYGITLEDISTYAGVLKKKAKSTVGSIYVRGEIQDIFQK